VRLPWIDITLEQRRIYFLRRISQLPELETLEEKHFSNARTVPPGQIAEPL
jgi:hypothetical protein